LDRGLLKVAVATLALAAAGIASAKAGAAPAAGDDTRRFAAFLASVYEHELAERPRLATEFGSKRGDDAWDDLSEAAQAARAARVRRDLAFAVRHFEHAALDPASRLQYRVFVDEQTLLLERYRWRDHFYALNQIVGLHIDVPGTLTGLQPLESEADALAYIRRIHAVRRAFRELEQTMDAQALRGIYMPKSVYPLLIEGAQNVIRGAPHTAGADSPIYADFTRRVALLDLPDGRKQALIADTRQALLEDLEPAYTGLIAYLKAQEARTPINGGVWQLPDGAAFYAFLIRQFTTTDMTPADIHAMGLEEVARSQSDMAALLARLGFQGSVREFMQKIKSDPHNYETDDDAGRAAYLDKARAIVGAMQARITEQFEAPAPLPLRIVRTEAYKEASSPAGFYEPGSVDGARPGTVYLNLADMKLAPLDELEDLLYHEGVPGHHLQISTILVDAKIPQLRKVNEWWQDSAFVEGWGLYAERLGKDMGFYRDPYSEFGLLSGELWRASRLVVDSGLHYQHWTREQAIAYLNDNTPSPEDTNARAVDRYLAVPGQATSFMVGMRQFVAERERARAALGARFDVREYHHIALSSGFIPLWALHDKVSAWIADKADGPDPATPVTPAAPATPAAPSAALTPSAALAPSAPFEQMLADYWQDTLRLNPSLALSQGERRYEAQFDDSLEDSWRDDMVRMLEQYQRAVRRFAPESLSTEQRTSLAMLREQLDSAHAFYASDVFETARRLPIDQFQGEHLVFAADAAGAGAYPFKDLLDYERALARADAYARWSDEAIGRLREGLATGVVLPRVVVLRILPQLRTHFGKPAEHSEFWQPLRQFPDAIPATRRAGIERAYRAKIERVIEPAYRRLYRFLRDEYLPHARASVGLDAIPGGAALYAHDVRFHTTTTLTPREIHELGRSEVLRIEAELAKVESALGVSGGLPELFAAVRANSAQKFGARSQIVPAFDAARERIIATLPRLFDVMPRAAFEIRALPDSSRESQGNGTYAPAGADGSRPGILWINTYAPGVADRFNVMTIMLHEGLPGHHFQTSIAQEQPGLPDFRRFDFTDAYGEGWALYAESLGAELGVFDDPWSYYGYLNYAILRANRLVVDTGLHALGWSLEQGIGWMMQHSSMTRAQAAAEVERYVAFPGQALSYKVGELKIRELRARAERELGAEFTPAAFHDEVLRGGSMPLTLLESRIDRWLAEARNKAAASPAT
jgi:uncharacterized protein (DUF885 family)